MSDKREYIKIEVEEEEEEEQEPTVYQVDPTAPPVTQRLSEAGQRVADAAQTAWESEQRRQASAAVRRGAGTAATRSREAVERAVSNQTKRKVRHGLAGGVYWLSQKLARLAERITPPPKNSGS